MPSLCYLVASLSCHLILITEGGIDLSIKLELLTLFSPFIRSLLCSLSRDSYQLDSSPIFLILPPDISIDVVLKLNSLPSKGKANFSNSLESREVLEAAELLGITIKELHRENGPQRFWLNWRGLDMDMQKKDVNAQDSKRICTTQDTYICVLNAVYGGMACFVSLISGK